MRVTESNTSRINQIERLMKKRFPALEMERSDQSLQFKTNPISQPYSLYGDKLTIRTNAVPLFPSGELRDLTLWVFDEDYFEGAKQFAQEYEQITQKSVTITKEF